jgi:hypothetical protein
MLEGAMSTDTNTPKIASDPDWFWRDAKAGRAAGLYGEILPERPKLEPEIAAVAEAATHPPEAVAL